jgi:hypothetical protein
LIRQSNVFHIVIHKTSSCEQSILMKRGADSANPPPKGLFIQ